MSRRRLVLALGVLSSICLVSQSLAQTCPYCEISHSKVAQYNAALGLTPAEKQQAEQVHLPYGIPKAPSGLTNEHLLHQHHFIINYDDDLRIPLWVAYQLRADDLCRRTRKNCFRRDSRLGDDQAAVCEDYEEPVYDRGHMVPRGDMNRSEQAMINTFTFANIAPQHSPFNRKIWKWLEADVRCWARKSGSGEIYVITGAVFDRLHDNQRDPDNEVDRMAPRMKVAVPTDFYKIILHERANGFIDTISVLLPHECASPKPDKYPGYLKNHIVSIDEIEQVTGINFLPKLQDDDPAKEAAVEAFKPQSLWATDCSDPPPCP